VVLPLPLSPFTASPFTVLLPPEPPPCPRRGRVHIDVHLGDLGRHANVGAGRVILVKC